MQADPEENEVHDHFPRVHDQFPKVHDHFHKVYDQFHSIYDQLHQTYNQLLDQAYDQYSVQGVLVENSTR